MDHGEQIVPSIKQGTLNQEKIIQLREETVPGAHKETHCRLACLEECTDP